MLFGKIFLLYPCNANLYKKLIILNTTHPNSKLESFFYKLLKSQPSKLVGNWSSLTPSKMTFAYKPQLE